MKRSEICLGLMLAGAMLADVCLPLAVALIAGAAVALPKGAARER